MGKELKLKLQERINEAIKSKRTKSITELELEDEELQLDKQNHLVEQAKQ